jgi:predicted alpha/beta-fold hydrolase
MAGTRVQRGGLRGPHLQTLYPSLFRPRARPALQRERLELADVPNALRGAPITLITAGLLTLAFMGFTGMIKM